MTHEELYKLYSAWTGQLHWYLGRLGKHLDVQFHPGTYEMTLYEGQAIAPDFGLPNLRRPFGELSVTLQMPRPEDNPTEEQLRNTLRDICFQAARILDIEIRPRDLHPEKSMLIDETRSSDPGADPADGEHRGPKALQRGAGNHAAPGRPDSSK